MRILLIEDEAALAHPLREHLEADFHIVEWFTTLDEAQSAIRTEAVSWSGPKHTGNICRNEQY